jgi:hypothetical protein
VYQYFLRQAQQVKLCFAQHLLLVLPIPYLLVLLILMLLYSVAVVAHQAVLTTTNQVITGFQDKLSIPLYP